MKKRKKVAVNKTHVACIDNT